MVNFRKCAIIGCGNVGATVAYTLVQSSLFSQMVLIDVNKQRAEGEALDISHSVSFMHPFKIFAGDYSDISDASIIIITAGAPQKEGQTRLDLIKDNFPIFKSIVSNINKYNTEAIIIVVSNPVDILTYMTMKLSNTNPSKIIGSGTVLDTARFKYLLGEQLSVDVRNVHAFIIGEHGDSELAVWSSANISGINLDNFCEICCGSNMKDKIYTLYDDVKNSAYEIINRKGSTYYGIAAAVLKIVSSIIRDENSILPVSTYISNSYGLDDICIGVPTVIGKNGVKRVLEIDLDDKERKYLNESASALKSVLKEIDNLM